MGDQIKEFQIKFASRTLIKGQALADFIVESTCSPETSLKDMQASKKPPPTWTLHTNGSFCIYGLGTGLILNFLDEGETLRYTLVVTFKDTNNDAENEVLIIGL